MKEKLKYLIHDPRPQLALAAVFFFIGCIDTWFLGAYSWETLQWWSATSLTIFCIILGLSFVRFFFLPLYFKIKKIFIGEEDK